MISDPVDSRASTTRLKLLNCTATTQIPLTGTAKATLSPHIIAYSKRRRVLGVSEHSCPCMDEPLNKGAFGECDANYNGNIHTHFVKHTIMDHVLEKTRNVNITTPRAIKS